MRRLGLLVLAAFSLLACSSGSSGSTSSSSSGGGGAPPTGPLVWEALPSAGAPSARYLHTAVWTGEKMVVWGGFVEGNPSVTATGALYDPKAKTWTPTSSAGAAEARHSHTAVWTGQKMLVWGGFGASGPAMAGGIYDPATDTWAPMSTAGQPGPRSLHTAVWTGSEMIICVVSGSMSYRAAAHSDQESLKQSAANAQTAAPGQHHQCGGAGVAGETKVAPARAAVF